ncbi:MAG: IS66 family insertion sequence element accessory protein TnpB [Vulcanimicrobiota bacterium]
MNISYFDFWETEKSPISLTLPVIQDWILFVKIGGTRHYYRRLERGRFRWPSSEEGQAMVISRRQLQWLLDGLNLDQPKAHRKVSAHIVI